MKRPTPYTLFMSIAVISIVGFLIGIAHNQSQIAELEEKLERTE